MARPHAPTIERVRIPCPVAKIPLRPRPVLPLEAAASTKPARPHAVACSRYLPIKSEIIRLIASADADVPSIATQVCDRLKSISDFDKRCDNCS